MKSLTKMDDLENMRLDSGGISHTFKLGELDGTLNFRLRRVRSYLTERYRLLMVERGARAGTFSALALIEANPGSSQIDLARFAGYDQTALVSIIDDLEKREWAVRRRDPKDRRKHRLEITLAGREALSTLAQSAMENERQAREALTPEELLQFRAALEKIYSRVV